VLHQAVKSLSSYFAMLASFLSIGTIDYRCDDEKKKLLSWGDIMVSLRTWLMTPGFQKCRSLTLSKHLFIRKLEKTILHGLSIRNHNFSKNSPFLLNRSAD
jgi:hypothetical protein